MTWQDRTNSCWTLQRTGPNLVEEESIAVGGENLHLIEGTTKPGPKHYELVKGHLRLMA